MINYFSIGVDARIGLSFDRNRQNSRVVNKAVYCWEGFKKMFMRTPGISETVDSL
jgi:diacylglycerol kinase (ATP)